MDFNEFKQQAWSHWHKWKKGYIQNPRLSHSEQCEITSQVFFVDDACRILIPNSKEYFHAMCMTDISKDVYEDIRLDWEGFGIQIDNYIDGIKFVLIAGKNHGKGESSIVVYNNKYEVEFIQGSDSLIQLLFEKGQYISESGIPSDKQIRRIEMLENGIIGMLYTLQHSNNWVKGKSPSKLKSNPRFGPPEHRNIFIGKPISIDVSKAVTDYISTGKSHPSFQTLVRGHHKRQVIGVGRSGRKIIWVEPYWRGPEDAPILSRPYKIG